VKYFESAIFPGRFSAKKERICYRSLTCDLKKTFLNAKKAFSHEKSRFLKKNLPPSGGILVFWFLVLKKAG
jgi:RES domain-containing protein